MSDDATEVRRLLDPLRDRPISVDRERLAARRERVITALRRDVRSLALARVSRARRRVAYAALSLAVAAGALLFVQRMGRPNVPPVGHHFRGQRRPDDGALESRFAHTTCG